MSGSLIGQYNQAILGQTSAPNSREAITECVVELCVDRWEEVAVGSESHVDGGVAHAFHHRPRMRALGDEERCVGVP